MFFVSIAFNSLVYGATMEFKNMLTEVGIPIYNVKNQEINQDIYEVYNTFVYGSPLCFSGKSQRWKSLYNGKWQYGGGKYTGTGTRGEYEALGYDYSGSVVYNYYFPLDRVTSVPVEKWTFLNLKDAISSWQNAEKYYTEEQVEYMKQAKWWFQNIKGGKNDPYDQIEYNLSANIVGLNKCKIEIPATWKTKGSIYVNRRTESGYVAWANFTVEPMAANANVKGYIKCNSSYILDENSDEICIPIEFGTNLVNLTQYAKAKHVKNIVCDLSVNSAIVASASGSKIISVGNKHMLVISRNQIPQNKDYQIELKLNSTVKTEFATDCLLQDTVYKNITIHVQPKKIIPVTETLINILTKEGNNWVVSPLAQNINTIKNGSVGICEAGRYLLIRFKLNTADVNKENIKNISLKLDGKKLSNAKILSNTTSDLLVYFEVPKDTATTMYGIKSMREKTQDYFNVDMTSVLTRKKEPHTLECIYTVYGKEYSEKVLFDTVDDYISNINMDITNNLTTTKFENKQILYEVINE